MQGFADRDKTEGADDVQDTGKTDWTRIAALRSEQALHTPRHDILDTCWHFALAAPGTS
jgi:hypothetical protein